MMLRNCFLVVCSVIFFLTLVLLIESSSKPSLPKPNLKFWGTNIHPSKAFTIQKREVVDSEVEVPCQRKSSRQLRAIIGPAFNPHYMSIYKPHDINQHYYMGGKPKNAFAVGEGYIKLLPDLDDAAEKLDKSYNFSRAEYAPLMGRLITKRDSVQHHEKTLPWMCPWYLRWIDMGEDTFPRYMRSVTCGSDSCWFDRMACEPRAFVVVVLKRKDSKCFAKQHIVDELFPKKTASGPRKLPQELQEQWEFEERAANFCCECVLK